MGGAEKNLCDIVLHLNRDKFIPYVLAFKGGVLTKFLSEKKVAVEENGVGRLFSIHALFKAFTLWRFVRNEKIDIIVSYHHDADIFGALVAKLSGTPIISSRRDMGYQLQKKHIWFYRRFSWLFSHFITVSDAVKHEIMYREGINGKKITTIHNGLEIEKFHLLDPAQRITLKKELGLLPDKIIIGMVASFRPIKGQRYLVEAISRMKKWQDKIQVVIVGFNETDYFRQVQTAVKDAGLESIFIFTGNRNDVPDILPLFDVFVISSKNEGFSNAIIEAMAAGVPVVAANSGGNSEAVENGKTGMLFDACNSVSLAKTLDKMLNSKKQMEKMGENGRKRVEEKFILRRMIESNEMVYKNNLVVK